MRTGAVRTEVDYAWPPFVKPAPPAPIAYLDLNHWISLAKAAVGHLDGRRSRPALEALRELHASRQVLPHLSATHYMEMTRISSARQRFNWRLQPGPEIEFEGIDPETRIELTEGISGINQEHLRLAERVRQARQEKTSQGNAQGNEGSQKQPFSDFS